MFATQARSPASPSSTSTASIPAGRASSATDATLARVPRRTQNSRRADARARSWAGVGGVGDDPAHGGLVVVAVSSRTSRTRIGRGPGTRGAGGGHQVVETPGRAGSRSLVGAGRVIGKRVGGGVLGLAVE